MGARYSSGFTIIETVLFLGVTGLLILGVLTGTSVSLNNQRYQDAVETFKNLLQEQYANLGSIRNDRANTWSCGADANPVNGNQIRGQSGCLILGRYMAISGEDISIYTVLASQTGTADKSDIEELNENYTYSVIRDDVDTRKMEWGAQIAWPVSGSGAKSPTTPRSIGLLFIRSPASGGVYTFSNDTALTADQISSAKLKAMMTTAEQGQRTICVDSAGLVTNGNMAVFISSYAAGTNAVETRSNNLEGVASQC